jgi:cell division protein FtsW
LLIVISLLAFGLLMVYSASWDFSWWVYDSPTYIFSRQLLWMAIGIVALVATAWMDYHYWRRLAVPAMLFTITALLVVLVLNEVRFGAVRTISRGSYMPSEMAKIVAIIYLSIWLYSKRNRIRDVYVGLLPLAGIIGLLSGLILAQPDLSAAATLVAIGGIMFFLAGGDLRQIALLLVFIALIGWVVVQIHPTGNERIGEYSAGLRDPTQASYHVRRSIEAFIKGGFFGVGIGRADTKYTGLPVPPTDSVFAVVGEETGLIGAGGLVILYGLFIWRGMTIAQRAGDVLGSLLASGLTLWIGMEALINMAVMVGLLPFAGNALPLISAGGSNLVVTMAGIGILMNIARTSKSELPSAERSVNAAHGLRRGHRRRRVSRAGGAAGARK